GRDAFDSGAATDIAHHRGDADLVVCLPLDLDVRDRVAEVGKLQRIEHDVGGMPVRRRVTYSLLRLDGGIDLLRNVAHVDAQRVENRVSAVLLRRYHCDIGGRRIGRRGCVIEIEDQLAVRPYALDHAADGPFRKGYGERDVI